MRKETLETIPPILTAREAAALIGVSYHHFLEKYGDESYGAVRVGGKYVFDRDKFLDKLGIKVS